LRLDCLNQKVSAVIWDASATIVIHEAVAHARLRGIKRSSRHCCRGEALASAFRMRALPVTLSHFLTPAGGRGATVDHFFCSAARAGTDIMPQPPIQSPNQLRQPHPLSKCCATHTRSLEPQRVSRKHANSLLSWLGEQGLESGASPPILSDIRPSGLEFQPKSSARSRIDHINVLLSKVPRCRHHYIWQRSDRAKS
jgi:hypothetical protein